MHADSKPLTNSESLLQSESTASTQPIDIDVPGILQQVDKRIQQDIDAWSIEKFKEDNRTHLGGSIIGENCMQKLYLRFHWAKAEVREGRMYRLLNRGNREEPFVFEMLRGIGFSVFDIDPDTGKQYRMSAVNGHYGGSIDAIAQFPANYRIEQPTLISVKTQGTGSAFAKLTDNGIQVEKQLFWDQECAYGHAYGINYATWIVVNKNDDSLHIETRKLDINRGAQLRIKAEKIIESRVEMTKISKSPTFKECTFCEMKGICFKGELPDKNCRSCKHSSAIENKQWYCDFHKDVIPKHIIVEGCGEWFPIVNAIDNPVV